jgi:hypothetical protein
MADRSDTEGPRDLFFFSKLSPLAWLLLLMISFSLPLLFVGLFIAMLA